MKRLIYAFVCGIISFNVSAQITPDELASAWKKMGTMVIETAKAMPADQYTFSPHKDLRDFASQIGHTLNANFMFAKVVKLDEPEEWPEESKDKEQILNDLTASFDFIAQGISKLSEEDLNDRIDWFGSKMSRMQAILTMTDHLQREHGKTITYVRLKGIAPARSAGW